MLQLSIVGGAGEAFALYSHGGNVRSEHDFLRILFDGGVFARSHSNFRSQIDASR